MNTEKTKLEKLLRIPSWLFVTVMAVLCELVLHLWTEPEIMTGRFAAVMLFGLGFGAVLGLMCSFFRGKGEKIAAAAVALALVVLYLTEYFMIDTYKTFMSLETLFSRVGDVAGDFMDTVLFLLGQNLVRIGLMLLPVILYILFARPGVTQWKTRGILAAAALGAYLLGLMTVNLVGTDADRLRDKYNLDSAVRSFGLHMGLGLDMMYSTDSGFETEFVAQVTLPPETEAETVPQATAAPETTAPTEPPVVYEPHSFDLDFEQLAQSTSYDQLAEIHRYVGSLTPAMENEYTGMFAGMNLIFITAESFSAEVIDPERTPTLYRMATEGIHFTDYYQPVWGASTTSGEYANLIGLVPIGGGSCMQEVLDQDMFLLLGKQLKALGYETAGYHNHSFTYYDRQRTHSSAIGLDSFVAMGNGMEEGVQLLTPESDLEMIDFTLKNHVNQGPFYLYYITMSGHAPYMWERQAMARKNRDALGDLEGSDAVRVYLAANMELEYAMESLVRQLEEAGIADNTVVVIASDHHPYALEKSSAWGNKKNALEELYGQEVTDCFIRDHNALIIWSGCLEDKDIVVDEPVYSLDLVPTLSNLFGLEYDSRLLVGRDVFSDEPPLVLWNTYSWKTDKGTFNSNTDVFTPAEGVTVEEGYVEYINSLVANKIMFSRAIYNWNYYDIVLEAMEQQE